MSKYTSAELQARATALIPTTAVLDRAVTADAEDIIESSKDRVARALHGRQEAPFFLAKLSCEKLLEYTGRLTAALATVERCAVAMQEDDLTSNVDALALSRQLADVLAAPKAVAQKQAARLAADIRNNGYELGSVNFGRTQALEQFVPALNEVTKLLALIDYTVDNVKNLLVNITSADLLQWTLRRQVRLAEKLYSTPSTDIPVAAVDLLMVSSLLDKTALAIDFTAAKYTGDVVPVVGITNRYTLDSAAPTGQYALLAGDIVQHAVGNTAILHSSSSTTIYLRSAPGWATVPVTILCGLYVAYEVVRVSLNNLVGTISTAGADFAKKAGLYAYSNTGLPAYRAVATSIATYVTNVESAVTTFSNSQEFMLAEVASLISALREERLFAVINYLEHCDFVGVSNLGYEDLSAVSTAGELLEQLANLLGNDTEDIYIMDGVTEQDDYDNRAR